MVDLSQIIPMKTLEFKIPISVESYDEKTAEKLPKFQRCRKAHSLQTITDINLKFEYHKLKT